MHQIQPSRAAIDSDLSQRPLSLDPGGYFIIYLDWERQLICAQHYANAIDEQGFAADPETGERLPAKGSSPRSTQTLYTGRTAKELCVAIFERADPPPVTALDHAAYLGREFVRAERALAEGSEYVQD
ncbi:MAG: hypothetical protein BRC58_08350 [Cyanobacteria bacterium QS_8_64_29]|nr:MAG: hypothetical protein BRC58_08350 [Cyanobacteria bacterium QS_8_64_29]